MLAEASPLTRRSAQRTGCSSSSSPPPALLVGDQPRGETVVAGRAAIAQTRDRRVGGGDALGRRLEVLRRASARGPDRAPTGPRARISGGSGTGGVAGAGICSGQANGLDRVPVGAVGAACAGSHANRLARDEPPPQALGVGLRGPAAGRRRDRRHRGRPGRAPRVRHGRARVTGPAERREPARPRRRSAGRGCARSARATTTSAPRTRGASPTRTWCAAFADASTILRTWSRAPATSARSRECSSGAPPGAWRRSPTEAGPASWAACSRGWARTTTGR